MFPGKFSLRSIDKCHFQGEEYELHAKVSQNETSKNCLASCGCYLREEKAYFNCAHIECPELFNGPLRDPKCFRQYSHDSCCSINTVCSNETTEGEKQHIHQCTYGGKQYYKGQKFYPVNECKICICDEGYDGSTNEPWCREFPCNVELIYGKNLDDGCVPIYYKSGCCPIDWRCPSSNDTIIEGPNHKNPSPEAEEKELFCKFGSLKLYLQDKLGDDSSNSDCTCITPPYPTCNLKPRPGAS
ncbi:hypothetical protein J437_LFUL011334 [Ladona fulva]|uniref:VWFC domain-containing protein n=1 Tax=Ladona fulva TaxID=123851 RepID=A0A8K0KBM0_LADFU|nr:hypothetical protein J437_LFUL011334 [Ladona fulva]